MSSETYFVFSNNNKSIQNFRFLLKYLPKKSNEYKYIKKCALLFNQQKYDLINTNALNRIYSHCLSNVLILKNKKHKKIIMKLLYTIDLKTRNYFLIILLYLKKKQLFKVVSYLNYTTYNKPKFLEMKILSNLNDNIFKYKNTLTRLIFYST